MRPDALKPHMAASQTHFLSNPQPTLEPEKPVAKVDYVCYDSACQAVTPIGPKDAVRCRQCGHRILWKKRPVKNVTQFEAR